MIPFLVHSCLTPWTSTPTCDPGDRHTPGSHPDRYGCQTYLKLTAPWLGHSKVYMACYRDPEHSFNPRKTGTQQWMGKAKGKDHDHGSGSSFSSSEVCRWIQEILQHDGTGFIPCSCPQGLEPNVTGPARGKNKNAPVPMTLHTLLSLTLTPRSHFHISRLWLAVATPVFVMTVTLPLPSQISQQGRLRSNYGSP